MRFGPYSDGRCFHIEKSRTYADIQRDVKMAEFILLWSGKDKPPVLWVVEAKSSAPRPENKQDFDTFIVEIREKLVNACSLCWASCMKRHKNAEAELPEPYKKLELPQVGVRFVLVINNHKEEWLIPLHEALNKALASTIKTWSFKSTSVAVINDELAREYELIISD